MNQTVPGDLGHSPGEDPPDPFQTAGKSTLIDPQSAIPLFVFPWFSCQSVSINSQFAIRLSFVSLCLSCQSISINLQSPIRNSPFIYLPGTYSTAIDLTISRAFVIPLISV